MGRRLFPLGFILFSLRSFMVSFLPLFCIVKPLRGFTSKKGIELQTTFLVVIIISIVIFGSGLYLMKKFFTYTSQFQEQIDENTGKEIERRLSESGEKVSIPINLKTFSIGDTKVFGLGVLNTMTPDTTCQIGGLAKPCNRFGVIVRYVTAVDRETQNSNAETKLADQKFIEDHRIPSTFPPVELSPYQLKVVSLPVHVANTMGPSGLSTRRGTIFIFNVCVFKKNEDSLDSGHATSCNDGKVDFVQNVLYGGRVLKMLVQVA